MVKKLLSIALLLTACGTQNITTNVLTTTSPDAPGSIMSEVNDYNQWRVSNGLDPVTQGLSCSLYTVPATTVAIIGATGLVNQGAFTYTGGFNQGSAAATSGLNILPLALQSLYQSNYIIKCIGLLVITADDYYQFNTVSDDGSNLYVDGTLVVNNDGIHGAQSVSAVKHLQDIVHTFEIDFLEANGNEQLVVSMNGSLLPAVNLYH